MHGKLVHVETSPLHLLKLEWQGGTRPETKIYHCTKVYHRTKVTNSMDLEKLIVCQLVKNFHAFSGTPRLKIQVLQRMTL
jgi:hypothetical protein